jgi:hypothetical protein
MHTTVVPRFWLTVAAGCALCVGCGFPSTTTGIIELDLNQPPAGLDADVMVGGSFDIPVTGSALVTYQVEGTLPEELEPTTGKVLILALRDISQPWLTCVGAATSSNCAVVQTQETVVPARVSLLSASRQVTFFLETTFELGEAPEPGCNAFLIGGTAVQWHVPLTEDLLEESAFAIQLNMRRTESPEVVFGWQLLLADPPSDPPSDQVAIGCL